VYWSLEAKAAGSNSFGSAFLASCFSGTVARFTGIGTVLFLDEECRVLLADVHAVRNQANSVPAAFPFLAVKNADTAALRADERSGNRPTKYLPSLRESEQSHLQDALNHRELNPGCKQSRLNAKSEIGSTRTNCKFARRPQSDWKSGDD
jgi:hypothetical protein